MKSEEHKEKKKTEHRKRTVEMLIHYHLIHILNDHTVGKVRCRIRFLHSLLHFHIINIFFQQKIATIWELIVGKMIFPLRFLLFHVQKLFILSIFLLSLFLYFLFRFSISKTVPKTVPRNKKCQQQPKHHHWNNSVWK